MLSNWRNLPHPRAKGYGAGPTYNRLNREKEGRREGVGRVQSSDELGSFPGSEGTQLFRNSSGNDGRQGRLIKTLGNLQDLSQRIYRKGKAEAVGWCGVDAGDLTGIESTSNSLRHVNLSAKRAGERSAGNLHAPFDVAGDGNQLRFGS